MAFVSVIRDTDAAIQESTFTDGRIALAYDANNLYIDILQKDGTQKRVKINGNDTIGTTVVVSENTPSGNFKNNDIWLITTDTDEDGNG